MVVDRLVLAEAVQGFMAAVRPGALVRLVAARGHKHGLVMIPAAEHHKHNLKAAWSMIRISGVLRAHAR